MWSDEALINMQSRLKRRTLDLMLKRILDLVLSIILIILLMPAMIVISIIIKLDSKGPAIFAQKRVGLHGKLFIVYKFRTMVKNAEDLFKLDIKGNDIGTLIFQDKNDTRITKIGAFLRRTSIDELPQLINVLIGNMSLVGPRPEIPAVADYYNSTQKIRLIVKPGITGLAQVSGRGEIELNKTIEYDLEYIKKFNILFDISILIRTITVVFRKEGAY